MSNPSAEWEPLGAAFYRKIQLYTAVFDQDLELDNYIVAGAPYGGAIGTFEYQAILATTKIIQHYTATRRNCMPTAEARQQSQVLTFTAVRGSWCAE
jgi:hypothetical protein